MRYDHVIVGGGTAGCVLAARLSEDAGRSVLVLEAGPDYPGASLPGPLRDSFAMPRDPWDWNLEATIDGRPSPLGAGKVIGGTSQVNGAGAWRPRASDFDAWEARGLPDWGWDGVVEYFNRVESDLDFGDRPWHGRSGPVPIARWRHDELLAPMRGWLEAVMAAGHPYCEDMNAPDATGVGVNPQSRVGRDRVSAATAYLDPARGRPGLTIRSGAFVESILVEGDRAVGVAVDGERIEAREVIVCAGVPLSPALLLRSGIGPGDALRAAGVEPKVELPGVGTRVMDQAAVFIMAVPNAGGNGDAPFLQLAARAPAFPGFPEDHAYYLCLFTWMPVDPALVPLVRTDRLHWLIVGDLAPASTGRVELRSADPREPPACDLGFYAVESDLLRMRNGFRAAYELAHHPAFTATIDRFAMIGDKSVAHDARLDDMLRKRTVSRQPWGGCPMGPDGEPEAVVDGECRVRGVDGLRVVDASVVPVPLRAGGALTCMMLGERLAERIRGTG